MTLRRHNTSPSSSAGRSLLAPVSVGRRLTRQASLNSSYRTSMKSNPYVGWFRHSPPTSPRLAATAASPIKTWQKNNFKNTPSWCVSSTAYTTVPASLAACKNSPHIGWFRHAPPSRLDLSSSATANSLTAEDQAFLLKFLLEQEMNPASKFALNGHGKQILLRHVIDGHLRGGGKDYLDRSHRQRSGSSRPFVKDLQESSKEGALSSVNALSRLASWFLFPVAHDAESCGYRQDADRYRPSQKKKHHKNKPKQEEGILSHLSPYLPTFLEEPPHAVHQQVQHSKYGARIVADNCDNGVSYSDDDDSDGSDCDSEASSSIASPPMPSNLSYSASNKDLSSSVSSLAEAYYAHQSATKDIHGGTNALSQSMAPLPPVSLDVGPMSTHRLDYVITQMDIARMSRNASRHLDVQSILSLPVITYRKGAPEQQQQQQYKLPTRNNTNKVDQYQGWSWTIVEESDSSRDSEVEATSTGKEEIDFCVICLEHFVNGDRLRVLPCHHSFHVGCIDRWLSGSQSFEECYTSGCPTCKKRPTVGKPTRSQSLCEATSYHDDENNRGDKHRSASLDGSVPSWAFAQIGSALVAQQEAQGASICSGSSSSFK